MGPAPLCFPAGVTPPSWLLACARFAEGEGVHPQWLGALEAFSTPFPRGGPPGVEPGWGGSFAGLDGGLAMPSVDAIAAELSDVDPPQARMFGRRVHAVFDQLEADRSAEARLLSVGLRQRLAGILAHPAGRALRTRALADFYYSQGARLRWSREVGAVRGLGDLAAGASWTALGGGLERGHLVGRGPDGPVEAWLLRVDPRRVGLRVVHRPDAADVPFEETLGRLGAAAGVSGGFFLYSEPDIAPPSARYDPVGLLLSDGALRDPGWLRRGALLFRPGLADLGVPDAPAPGVWTRARGAVGPATPSRAVVGGRVVDEGTSLPIPLNGAVVEGTGPLELRPPALRGAPAVEGIAGGPILLERGRAVARMRQEDFWGTAPPVTFSQDETGGRNLLPRHGVGRDRAGRLLFAAVDGRDFQRSLGVTLAGLGELLSGLGAEVALNLDGGSSKRMVIEGRTVDRSSTEVRAGSGPQPLRPVHTAIAFLPG